MIECPCKYCTKETGRYPGCHDHCEKEAYIIWKEQQKALKRRQKLESSARMDYNYMKSDNIHRILKKISR